MFVAMETGKKLKVAILDLYEGHPNEGMRCLRNILREFSKENNIDIEWNEFDVRLRNEVPDMRYDVFISSGGPGNPMDSREYQVIQPNYSVLEKMGARILCIEKERPHVPYERAVMGIRFNEYMIGTQFHPEADVQGMTMYLHREDKKKMIIENYGEA